MRSVVFTFARMNPPTQGHKKLITSLVEAAKLNEADHRVFLSQTQNNKTDPLEWDFKRRVCQAAFPGVKISTDLQVKTPFQALEALSESYEKVIFVVGEDREKTFKERMPKYAEQLGVDLEIISAGKRDPLSEGVEGVSATKLRKFAIDNDKENFYKGLPSTLNKAIKEMVLRNTRRALK
jgi:hypothetical protein